jgi:hypothetical protein
MSTMRRVYLPLSQAQLQALHEERELGDPNFTGFGATRAARSEQPEVDDEEVHEYRAAQDAARAALAAGGCVVAAADVAASGVLESGAGTRLTVPGPLALKRFASFHLIDEESAAQDPEAELELSWFDATELTLLLDALQQD